MTVILGLSQISYDWTFRVSCGWKSSLWLRREKNTANVITSHKETESDISLPLHKHLCLWNIHTSMGVWHVTPQLEFLPVTPGFCMLILAQMDFFPHWGFIFPWATCVSNHADEWHRPVSMAKSRIYFKHFYSLKISTKYFSFVKKEKSTRNL